MWSATAYSPWDASIQKRAWEAFVRDFDELLRAYPGKWVAYRGPERLAVADKDSDLYAECRRRGVPAADLLVERIEPAVLDDYEVFLPPVRGDGPSGDRPA
jgi:hypothetical protein